MTEFQPACLCRGSTDPAISLRWRKDGYEVVECERCGLIFRRDPAIGSELATIYDADYFGAGNRTKPQGYLDYLGDQALHRMNARRRLHLLERFRAAGRLLDVGCAAGFFLDEARSRGWEVAGVDVAPAMAAWAREKLGLEIFNVPFQNAEPGELRFEAVTMWDYIEHSPDPLGDLRKANALLEIGGIVAVSTGDASSLVARASGRRWHLLTPRHHNFFFTAATLRRVLQESGFGVVYAGHLSSLYSLRYLFHKLRTLADLHELRALNQWLDRSRLGDISIPLNLWDISTMIGRKL
jgi:2-polyprenyl-3-methyl-5-hydroxy-6-metoxy-1,4-benzoquinol methylase